MQISRRRLLETLGACAAVGGAGCNGISGVDDVVPGTSGGTAPSGSLDADLSAGIYSPGRLIDVEHRLLAVRDIESLREHRGENHVATGLIERQTGRVEQAFDQDPAALSAYAQYGPTQMFVGSFAKDDLLASYRSDDWTVSGTHHGIDVLRHPENPDFYASGVGEGVFLTTGRHREAPATGIIRAHAEAFAGETERYRDDPAMSELLSVVGGGDYVTAITSPVDLGERPPYTAAIGRSLAVEADSVVDTMAFVFDESAPESPEHYTETWSERADADSQFQTEGKVDGRVGYFVTRRPEDDFQEGDGLLSAIRDGDPTESMQNKIDQRYTDRNGQEPPDASFEYQLLSDATETDCGDGDHVVAVTYRSGPEIPAQRLTVFDVETREVNHFSQCGYTLGDPVAPGDSVRIGFQAPPGDRFGVYWSGPHGNTAPLAIESQ